MALETEVTRVVGGLKGTLKKLITKLGGTVGDELIDEYAALVDNIEVEEGQSSINAVGVLKGVGNGVVTVAVPGTDYMTPEAMESAVAEHNVAEDAHSDIRTAVADKAPAEHQHTVSNITDFPTSMPASDVFAWAKAETKPSYTASEVDAVSYTAEAKSETKKSTARSNIGAASLADLAKKPDALKTLTTLHVAKTGSDTTGDGSESKPYLTIQKAVDSLPKLLLNMAYIYVHAGTYEENVNMHNFLGSYALHLIGVSGESVKLKTLYVKGCSVAPSIYLKNLELIGSSGSPYNWSLMVDNVFCVTLEQVTCTQAVASADYGALRFQSVPVVRMLDVTVSNKPIALDVLGSTVYLNNNCTGTGNTVGIRCGSAWGQSGGFVQKGGASIAGEEQKGFGGQIW